MENKTAQKSNRLIKEKSPYLLQHAHNPVDWFPWGEEAFAQAAREDKPIFLSIGYSTCHWCHVMERESFEDPEVARIMNEQFISIKVDREERPDVDQLYMQAVMAIAGQGGWPLSVFLTPDRKPFFGGTYFPPESRWGQPGFKDLLRGIAHGWAQKRQELLTSGEAILQVLQEQQKRQVPGQVPLADLSRAAYEQFAASYDETFGGFEPAPKFPRAHALSFLLRYGKRFKEPHPLEMVEKTLKEISAGGITDHLGGGFHRYSTDAQWHLPHFEKMLYDQAILARAYLETAQVTGEKEYADAAREIFGYLLREMTDAQGGFYSAEDADSPVSDTELKEGAFYIWSQAELEQLLGPERSRIFGFLYGAQSEGNVRHDPTGEFEGKNILHRAHTRAEAAAQFKVSEQEVDRAAAESKKILFEARGKRPRPHLDDKILTDWNGLMISSMAFGSRVLGEPKYAQAAQRAAQFILDRLVRKDGRLLHRYRDGEPGILGTLEDYAFFIHGLIDLYEATFQTRYLAETKRLTQEMVRLFWDERQGGFFLTGTDAEQLLLRQKELYDGAIPSGNSVAALDLLRVGRLTVNDSLEKKAQLLFETFAGQVAMNPSAYPQLLIALDFALGPSAEIVIAGPADSPETEAMVQAVFKPFLPNKVVAFHPTDESARQIETLVPFIQGLTAKEAQATAYLCRNYACDLPTTDLAQFQSQLRD